MLMLDTVRASLSACKTTPAWSRRVLSVGMFTSCFAERMCFGCRNRLCCLRRPRGSEAVRRQSTFGSSAAQVLHRLGFSIVGSAPCLSFHGMIHHDAIVRDHIHCHLKSVARASLFGFCTGTLRDSTLASYCVTLWWMKRIVWCWNTQE
jgi:hypothetical protein